MASIKSAISLFVLLLVTYCYAVPVPDTTVSTMLDHAEASTFLDTTTFINNDFKARGTAEDADEKQTRGKEEDEDNISESTTDHVLTTDPIKREFEDFTSSFDDTTEKVKAREMSEETTEDENEEHTTSPPKHDIREFDDVTTDIHESENKNGPHTTSPPKHAIREFDDITFSSFDDTTEKQGIREMGEHESEDESEGHTTSPPKTDARGFEPESFIKMESSTEFDKHAIHGTPSMFEHGNEGHGHGFGSMFEHGSEGHGHGFGSMFEHPGHIVSMFSHGGESGHHGSASMFSGEGHHSGGHHGEPEWFEKPVHGYGEPEVVEEEKKILVKDLPKKFEPKLSVDSYGKHIDLLHDEPKTIVTEDKYTKVEKVFHDEVLPTKKVFVNDYETKVFHDEVLPTKKVLVNNYETKVFHDEVLPTKKVLVNNYETKILHDETVPRKEVLINKYEAVKPVLDEVKVKTVFTEKKPAY